MGEIWMVPAELGVWAVKALFSWAEYPSLPADVRVQQLAMDAGIALPRPVVHDGVAVVVVDDRRYRAYEWADLAPPPPTPVTPELAAEAGQILGLIHGLPPEDAEDAGDWYTTAATAENLAEQAEASLAAGATWGPDLVASHPAADELRQFVAVDHGQLALCHRDFEPSNVMPSVSTGALVTLDWENVGPLAADEELGSALLAWCVGSGTGDWPAVASFLDGYRSAGGTASLRPDRSFSVAACTTLNFLRVMADQALLADEHLAFAETQLDAMLHGGLADLVAAIRALADGG
jgi:Ser/Thr protein kinase RdoA (MazF antagonist)